MRFFEGSPISSQFWLNLSAIQNKNGLENPFVTNSIKAISNPIAKVINVHIPEEEALLPNKVYEGKWRPRFTLLRMLGITALLAAVMQIETRINSPKGLESLNIRTYDCNHIPQKEVWGEYRMYSCLLSSTLHSEDQIPIYLTP